MDINLIEMPLDALAGVLFMLAMQLWKTLNPVEAEKQKKWIALIVAVLTGGVSLLRFLAPAFMGEILGPDYLTVALLAVGELLEGVLLGGSAVGLYEIANKQGVLRSTKDLLVLKSPVEKRVETTEVANVVEVEPKAVTTIEYEPEVKGLDGVEVATFEAKEVEVKPKKRSYKRG